MVWALVALTAVAALTCIAGWYVSEQIIRRRTPDRTASPSDCGLEYEDVSFTSEDGIPLQGWLIPAGNSQRVVIFLHGHAGSMDPDVKYVPWFHERGIAVLMFDFRGHGRSGGQRVSMGFWERRDLLAAEEFLLQRGHRRIGVLGFSMGGAVAIAGSPLSQRIVAVAADGSFAWLSSAIRAGIEERGVPRALAALIARLAVRIAGWRLGANLDEAAPALWTGKIAPRALLLIHGEEDPYTSTEEVRAMFAAAGEPKELWVVSGAGHRNVDEAEPEAYKERVMGFFDRWFGEQGGGSE